MGVSSASRHRCCICSHNSSASPSAFCPEKLGRTSPNPPPRTAAAAAPGARGRGSRGVPPGVQRRWGWRAPAVDLGGVGSRMRPAAPFGLCLVQARRRWMVVPSRVCRGRRCPLQEGASRHHGDFIRGVCSHSPLHPSGSRGAAGRGPGTATHPPAQAPHQAVAGREAAQSAFKLGIFKARAGWEAKESISQVGGWGVIFIYYWIRSLNLALEREEETGRGGEGKSCPGVIAPPSPAPDAPGASPVAASPRPCHAVSLSFPGPGWGGRRGQ